MTARIATVDMHTGGEPLRIVVAGVPELVGTTILERRRWLLENADWMRKVLMWEPRGHAEMYGCFVVPPERQDSDFGAIFMHNAGYSTMCGHATLALARFSVDEGLAKNADLIRIDVPAGQVVAKADYSSGAYLSSSFQNVGSFVLEHGAAIDVEQIGRVRYDLVFGGAFYAVVDAASVGVSLEASAVQGLVACARKIKQALCSSHEPQHPFEPDLSFLYGVIFTGPPGDSANHSRNVCVFADGEVDRSPTGSGVSGRIALHVARGEVQLGQTISIESVIGSTMTVRAIERVKVGDIEGVIPEVGGCSYYTGRSEFIVEEDDPLRQGFLVR